MDRARKTACPENEDVSAYLLNKRQELAQSSKWIPDNMDMTLSKRLTQTFGRGIKKMLSLKRCGLKKLLYLVEGDPNSSEVAESIKTACFTTEIFEGFDAQRTNELADTIKKYGHLTQSINQYYRSLDPEQKCTEGCHPYDKYIKRCEELDKMTVPQVTEEIALAVLDLYPTLLSLPCAYSLLEGDVSAQEEMLERKSNNLISGSASKSIFQLVWGGCIASVFFRVEDVRSNYCNFCK